MDSSDFIITGLEQNYNVEQHRLNSFGPWFSNEVDKKKLARAGFFYLLERDHVKCVFCEVKIGGWMRGDHPFIEHKSHSPNCPFINEAATNNFPIQETIHLLSEELAFLRKWTDTSKSTNTRDKLGILSAERMAETARHPSYADKEERLKSFVKWPMSLKQTPEELSEAGFFYLGIGDEVKCFYCAGCLRNFVTSDHALNEHKKHFFDRCKYIQLIYKNLRSNTYKLENRRPIKATIDQIQHLIEFMEQNNSLHNGTLLQDRVAYVKTWKDLTKTLNELGGATKDIKGWKEVWRNYKYNQKRKLKLSFEMDTASTSSSRSLHYNETPQVEVYETSMESMNVGRKDGSNLTTIEEIDLHNFTNMDPQNVNISFEPIMFTFVDEKTEEKSDEFDILNKEILQHKLKIEELNLEIEKHKLELEMKIRQKELIQKQKDLQNKYQQITK